MIYIRMYVGMSTKNMYAKMCGRNYVAKIRAFSRSVLGRSRPVTPILFTHLLYARVTLAWTKKKPKKNSLRNEKLKAKRASETVEQNLKEF